MNHSYRFSITKYDNYVKGWQIATGNTTEAEIDLELLNTVPCSLYFLPNEDQSKHILLHITSTHIIYGGESI